ncbi:hypothetical protein GGTG_10329 [Gaeumannomyces tritici R3-111a-1]|uniref:Uncharacterized protein n=1 Tax=Gaeumannomyces tritici (strain R3-111a-1) TaxID=644352 RepID=J3PA05_GAET3|nr:hypothetical protein GGTG_10329 [Gaeumannomyces tritici R3-111a-1]EJT73491.1 hypothetical protein GGTG_10329 [Gaeumannomyces tritici R3-111a-1]
MGTHDNIPLLLGLLRDMTHNKSRPALRKGHGISSAQVPSNVHTPPVRGDHHAWKRATWMAYPQVAAGWRGESSGWVRLASVLDVAQCFRIQQRQTLPVAERKIPSLPKGVATPKDGGGG